MFTYPLNVSANANTKQNRTLKEHFMAFTDLCLKFKVNMKDISRGPTFMNLIKRKRQYFVKNSRAQWHNHIENNAQNFKKKISARK